MCRLFALVVAAISSHLPGRTIAESSSSLLLLLIKLYILVTHLISLIFYRPIITSLQGLHVHLPAIYLTFRAISCLLVLVHFEFPHHKYIIPFLFISIKLKHSPLSDVILRFIIFSLLILPLSLLSNAP